MAKFCPNCGTALESASKFCPSCGAQVMDAGAPPAVPQTQELPRPAAAPTPQQPQMQPPQNQAMPMQGAQQPQAPQGPMQGRGPQLPMQNQPMAQPPMMRGPQGQPQPMMYQTAPGQKFGQQPYGQGQWPGQGAPNVYGPQAAGAFSLGPLGTDESFVKMFLGYEGRLNRKPYIMRGLALFLGFIVVSVVLGLAFGTGGVSDSVAGILNMLMCIVLAVPGCMLAVRRLHDLDRPTWWIIGNFIPFVNVALSFYLLLAKGTTGPNQYGPDPLEGQY
jgi:uncharacterized membrane protein YhaH (DUF805 family)